MKKVLYSCYNTGEIKEDSYCYEECQFSIVKKYRLLYEEALPRFVQNGNSNIYALPFESVPEKTYNGLDRISDYKINDKRNDLNGEQKKILKRVSDICCCFYEQEELLSQQEAEILLSCLDTENDYELIWTKINGSEHKAPEGFCFAGYDIAYPPDLRGAFSMICDCMFICKWHGCDKEGTLFSEDFQKLNENGLFENPNDACSYMEKYLNQDWSERGEYGIYGIYLKR